MASLDDPQVEYLSRIHHIVLFANPPAELLMLIPGKSGDNTVDPVRRIYTDLMIPRKGQELINYLEDNMPHAKNREKAEALLESLEQLKDQPVKGKSR